MPFSQKRKLELAVSGMHCASCPNHVERALRSVPGVEKVHIPNWESNTAEVIASSSVNDQDLLAAVKQAGYPATVRSVQVSEPRVVRNRAGGPNGDGRKDFDLIVIGGGSAGFAAALKGLELGAKVALVEADRLGGTCVNAGCVPSKTLIQVAKAWHSAGHHPFKGAFTDRKSFDWPTVRSEKDALVASMRKRKYEDVLAAYPEITFIEGLATFKDDGSLTVGGDEYSASQYVITTGGKPNMIPFPGIEGAEPLNSTNPNIFAAGT